MPKVAGDIADELIEMAVKLMPKTKQEEFWAKVNTKAQELNEIMEFQRQDSYELGHGDGFDKGYKKGYHDGHTDQLEEGIDNG